MNKKAKIISSLTVCILTASICMPVKGYDLKNDFLSSKIELTGLSYTPPCNSCDNLPLKKASEKAGTLTIKSSAYTNASQIPVQYACSKVSGGKDLSIPLEWSGAPKDTKSYAVFMYDLNPVANNFVHWAAINIPSNVTALKEGASRTQNMPLGSLELPNSAGGNGYEGPCPPVGTGKHEYKITVYALNTQTLNLSGPVTLDQFQAAINGKVLGQSELTGYFEQQ